MTDFNSKYTGQQVEDLLDQVASGNTGGGGGGITAETDPVFSASPAASITDAKMSEWDGKQNVIADLESIRSGATAGATALQSIPEEYVTEDQLIWTKVEGEAGVRLKGTNGTATGNLAISAGDDKTASDGTPFASVASGDHAVAFGYGNTCSGRTTLAQGLYNIVAAKDSVAFGQRNTVNGDQAFAAGQQNEVAARLGVAIGYKNKTTNTDSIAIGYQNTSSGSASVAMGDTCEATGTSSTAMGYKTKATGAYSSTFGQNTQATNNGEVAMGLYNKSTTSTDASEQTLFSFGIGTSDTNRANALEIKKNGDVYVGNKLLSIEDFITSEDLAAVATSGNYNDLVDIPTFKTINGESIVGEGDITISGGSGSSGGMTYVEDATNANTQVTIQANQMYAFKFPQTNGRNVSFAALGAGQSAALILPYKSGSVSLSHRAIGDIIWADDDPPVFEDGWTYEIQLLGYTITNPTDLLVALGCWGRYPTPYLSHGGNEND